MKKKVMMLIVVLIAVVGLPAAGLCQEESALVIEAAPADTGPPFVEEIYDAIEELWTAIDDWTLSLGDESIARVNADDDLQSQIDNLGSIGRVKQLVHDFVVAAGEDVSAGDVVALFSNGYVKKSSGHMFNSAAAFNDAVTEGISVTALSETKFVVTYSDSGNSGYGTAVVGEVSGSTVIFGSEYVFNSGSTLYVSVAALSGTKFVVTYQDGGNLSYGTAVVGEVSGSTISFGSEYIFNSASTSYTSVAALTETKFVVTYRDSGNSGYGTAVVGEVSGNIVSFGSEDVFNIAGTNYISVAALSESKFVVTYFEYPGAGLSAAVVGEVSGSTITFGLEYVFSDGAFTSWISAAALSDTKFIVAYQPPGSSLGTAVVGEVSGDTVGFGSEYVFNSAATSYISVAALSDTEFVVTYCDGGNLNHGTAVVGEVFGNTISFGAEDILDSATPVSYTSTIQLADDMFVVCYGAGNGIGSARTGRALYELGVPLGVAGTYASAGEEVEVIIEGISGQHSDLMPGQFYYSQSDGSLTLDPTMPPMTRIGVATSATELLVDIQR